MTTSNTAITDLKSAKKLPRWFHTVFSTVQCLERGRLEITLPDGRTFVAEGKEDGPLGVVHCHNNKTWGRTIRDGADIGFAEAYIDGWWSTPDLHAVLDVSLLNNEEMARNLTMTPIARLVEGARHFMRRNTKSGSRKNIHAHYDLGNAFYELWLDSSMTYSSGLYSSPGDTLELAQYNKYAALCDNLGLTQDQTVLEIGCGWGGFAEFAAKERGAKVTGLTISQAQHDYAKKRIFDAGLNERVDIVMRDYRDERGTYDRVASIEMFEAVGEKFWPIFFNSLRDRLAPGGLASMQVITIADSLFEGYRGKVDFVQKHIFPGGMLPSPTALKEQTAKAGLNWTGSTEFGQSYSTTLRKWSEDFNSRWDEIEPLGFDEPFRRKWNFYLASCAACFLAGTTDVTQMTVQRA
jgi:cyclopropane-fatty-acyl-phospholipid synthase